MKAPEFWARRGFLAGVLSPLGAITQTITARRAEKTGFDPGIPVFCAGNATVGGSGKTILALDLLSRLPGKPFALTRGYKGDLSGPILVNPAIHTTKQVGDEAFLLAAAAPTILSRDRAAGARFAISYGATCIVMDDGLQNPALKKTVSFLVIDGGFGFGNGFLLPAGPLREPVMQAAVRCQAAVIIGADTTGARKALPATLPVLQTELIPTCAIPLQNQPVIAFAGIGRPAKFFSSVSQLGGRIAASISFPDHHPYTSRDAATLHAQAIAHNALLVTTEKDYVKLPASLRAITQTVSVNLRWADESTLTAILSSALLAIAPPTTNHPPEGTSA